MQHAREWLAGETCRRTLDLLRQQLRPDGPRRDTEGNPIAGLSAERSPSSSTPASCGSRASRTPTATSTRSRPATGCGARTWPTTTATACFGEAERRRRPEPQLRHELGPRQRGLVGRPDERDLPRRRPGLRARDQGDEGAVGQGRLRVPEERPHGGRAAAVSAGLPAVHADARQRHLRGAGRQRRRLGDRRQGRRQRRRRRGRSPATASTRTCRPSSTSPTATRSTTRYHTHGILAFTPEGSEPASRTFGVRVPGRRGRHRGGVPAPPAVLARPRAVGRRPGEPDLAPRQHASQDFYVETFADSYGDPQTVEVDGQALARQRRAALPHQRRRGAAGADEGGAGRRALRQRQGRLLPPPARRW